MCRLPLWLWARLLGLSGSQQFLFCWDSPCYLKLGGRKIWESPEDEYVKYGVLRYHSDSGCTSTWDTREMHSLMFGEGRERVTGENLKVKTHSEGLDMNKNFRKKKKIKIKVNAVSTWDSYKQTCKWEIMQRIWGLYLILRFWKLEAILFFKLRWRCIFQLSIA